MSSSASSSRIVWLPLADASDLHRDAAQQAISRGCAEIQISHYICHDVDDLLDHPERARRTRELVAGYRRAGLSVWCWTHEFRLPPKSSVRGARLDFEDPAIWRHLEEKYRRFLTEILPEIDGLVLTFAETDFPVYQDEFIQGGGTPAQRTARLANALHGICRRHGKRLAIRDFVYRRHEVEAMADALAQCDDGIAIMTKCVPHDWHPFYPINPLLGRVGAKEQWIEFDFGHEYEGQHLYPYAEVEANLERLRHAHACGVQTLVVRLDRPVEFRGRSALHTPWGRLELLTVQRFAENPRIEAEEIWGEWERSEFPGARRLVEQSTRAVQQMLFPHEFWYADHSRLPTWEYAATHLVDGNADRLPVWTGDALHREREWLFRTMPPAWLEELLREAERAQARAAECAAILTKAPSDKAGPWRSGLHQLGAWMELFAGHRRAYFLIEFVRRNPGQDRAAEIALAVQALEESCRRWRPLLADAMLEDAPATANFDRVVKSLRDAAAALRPKPTAAHSS
jgi:hypothetical protein